MCYSAVWGSFAQIVKKQSAFISPPQKKKILLLFANLDKEAKPMSALQKAHNAPMQ